MIPEKNQLIPKKKNQLDYHGEYSQDRISLALEIQETLASNGAWVPYDWCGPDLITAVGKAVQKKPQMECSVCAGVKPNDDCVCDGVGTIGSELHGLRKAVVSYMLAVQRIKEMRPCGSDDFHRGVKWALSQIE